MDSDKILKILKDIYPSPKIELQYSSPFELLISTILSAQCTDQQVNKVTKELFKKYKHPDDFAKLSNEQLENIIKSTGFYKNKSKSIINTSRILTEKYNGELPLDIEELSKLPGVGRKTANVVLGECFNIPSIVVDTHVKRFSKRSGLTTLDDPVKIEFDLMKKLPQNEWTFFSKAAILHGRYVCKAKNPLCDSCLLEKVCPKIF